MILHDEFQFSESRERKERLQTMCNLSADLVEKGIKRGIKQGIEQGIKQGIEQGQQMRTEEIVRNMLKNGISHEIIKASIPNLSDEDLDTLVQASKV